jgi:hypothetical protein
MQQATAAGAELRCDWPVQHLQRQGEIWQLHGPAGSVSSRTVVIADGSGSTLGKPLGLGAARPRFASTMAVELDAPVDEPDTARFDFGLTQRLMVSGFYASADDPLYNPITGRNGPVANLWDVAGGALRVQLAQSGSWQWALDGSLEQFTVGSGCGGADNCAGPGGANMFNTSGGKVLTCGNGGSAADAQHFAALFVGHIE